MMHVGYANAHSAKTEPELELFRESTSFSALHIVSTINLNQDNDVYARVIQEARQYIHNNFCQKITVVCCLRKLRS